MQQKYEKTETMAPLLGMRVDTQCPKCNAKLKNLEIPISDCGCKNKYGITISPLMDLSIDAWECEICGTEELVEISVKCLMCEHIFNVILSDTTH